MTKKGGKNIFIKKIKLAKTITAQKDKRNFKASRVIVIIMKT